MLLSQDVCKFNAQTQFLVLPSKDECKRGFYQEQGSKEDFCANDLYVKRACLYDNSLRSIFIKFPKLFWSYSLTPWYV